MKFALYCFLIFYSVAANSQRFSVIDKRFKQPLLKTNDISKLLNKQCFVFESENKDSIVNALEDYIELFSKVGRANYPFTDSRAGNTVIKVATKPMAYGDRYTISAETNINNSIYRIMFGDARQKNKYTVDNIRKFIDYVNNSN
jgi:hypothetical protein